MLEKGYTHLYFGYGKGKTTAAVGLGIRAVGAGMKVAMIQLLKGVQSSEEIALKHIPNFDLYRYQKSDKFYSFADEKEKESIILDFKTSIKKLDEILSSNKYDMIILDEILDCIDVGLMTEEDVVQIISEKPSNIEIVLTGHKKYDLLIEKADLVTETTSVKHYMDIGVAARKGIEY